MSSCPACNTANSDSAKYCAECGARLPSAAIDEEHRKTVTVLFADITGSTHLGERLEPESLRRMLARFFDVARSSIAEHGGTVEKFIGDAVMAVFGVPVVHEDDAARALRAALDLVSRLESLNGELAREFGATLEVRIGVNTGDVVTGTAERLATGDAVNVAARLEQLAAPGQIFVGELTAEVAGWAATFAELEPAHVKGKSAPIRVFRLVSASTDQRPMRSTPMIGRQRQLQALRGAFAQTVADRACVQFTVLGVAGVGKSRLVAEFLRDLDATVVRGRCPSYGTGIGLWHVIEVVRQLQQGAAAGPVEALIAGDEAVAGAVRALLEGNVSVASTADLAWAVRRMLEQAAEIRPLVVVLDDLQWAEPVLFEIMEHIVGFSRDAPILMLAMARPELLDSQPGWGGGALNATTVHLEPLEPAEARALVDQLSPSLDASTRERVRAAAAGNPLFAEEMVALVEASGDSEVQVPATIRSLLAARLDLLDPAEVRILERASVEGESFHRSALEALTVDEPELTRRLLSLIRKDVLRPDRPTIERDEAYRFRHVLLRDAAYERLAKSTRAQLHEQFARWVEARGAQLVEQDHLVGYHLERAYELRTGLGAPDDRARALAAEAATRLKAAGRREMARLNLADAANLMDRASRLAPDGHPDVSLELAVAAALMESGRPADAEARAAAAAESAQRAGDSLGATQAELARLCFAMSTGTEDDAQGKLQQLVDAALPQFEAARDDAALAWAWWARVHLAHQQCRSQDALDALDKTQHHAERSGDPFLTAHLFERPAQITFGLTPIPQALELLAELRRTAPGFDPWIDAFRARLLADVGRFDEARALHAAALEAFRDRGMLLAAAVSGQEAWAIAMAAGDIDAAVAAGRASCAELERMGERGFMSTNAAQLAEALYLAGDDAEAQHWVERALELGEPGDALTQAQARLVRALIAARAGERDRAEHDTREALRISAPMQDPMWQGQAAMNAARVFATLGARGAAADQLREAAAFFSAKGASVYLARALDALAAMGEPV